ncbi:MAG: imidazolonepropionase [Acidimicrobiia bacterium]|nr:MAG: imidazolonepropionase [Acidimicrobiia bacterium]
MTGSMGPTLITHIGQLVTNDPARGGLLGIIEDAAIEVVGERVSWIGTMKEVEDSRHVVRHIDVGGAAVVPGFVDAHTHAVFAGDRADEFAMRMAGAAYEDILASGGGIYSTVAATREATLAALVSVSLPRFENMLASGTTTAEVKSGYGLDVVTEVKMLEAVATISDRIPIDLVATFLGAHVVAPEYQDARNDYIDLVTGSMLESVAPLASFIDVFCDDAAFTVDEARTIAMAGIEHGLDVRLHVDQLSRSGGTALAAELGTVSADHVDHATDEDLAALATAGTVAVLLPGVSYAMRTAPPDARKVWDAGVTVAIATDCNPGTAYIETMPFIISLAVVYSGLTPEEALWAATRGGATALGLNDRGLLAPGTLADLVILDAPTHTHLAYRPDGGLALEVMKRGSMV